MWCCSLAVLILVRSLGLPDEKADYEKLGSIWRKTEPESDHPKGIVTDEERKLLLKELDGHRDGIAPHDFRRMAAITLGNLKAKEAVASLITHLKDSEEYHMVSAEAARALGKIGDTNALPHLLDALDDDRTGVRRYAALALRSLEPNSKDLKPFATAKRFRTLMDRLEKISLPSPDQKRNDPLGREFDKAYWTALHVDSICTGLNLAKPEKLTDEDQIRAEKLAEKILTAGFPAFVFTTDRLPELARFCQGFQPSLYAERIKTR